jgi:hypothetical protein
MPNDVEAAQTKHAAEALESGWKLRPSLVALVVSLHPNDAHFVRWSRLRPAVPSIVQYELRLRSRDGLSYIRVVKTPTVFVDGRLGLLEPCRI